MATEYTKCDTADGRFLLHRGPGGVCDQGGGGNLGRSGSDVVSVFGSDEARQYYIQAAIYEEVASHALRELHGLRRSLVNCVMPSGRLRKKRLLEIIEEANRQLAATEKI